MRRFLKRFIVLTILLFPIGCCDHPSHNKPAKEVKQYPKANVIAINCDLHVVCFRSHVTLGVAVDGCTVPGRANGEMRSFLTKSCRGQK